ncbi:MAG: hypothetical protein Ta2A_23800 [Treponemataceae bacterium]|nr:MAG: hypothetical protein Ta2A_23800 [Treponemataceae bacterium]
MFFNALTDNLMGARRMKKSILFVLLALSVVTIYASDGGYKDYIDKTGSVYYGKDAVMRQMKSLQISYRYVYFDDIFSLDDGFSTPYGIINFKNINGDTKVILTDDGVKNALVFIFTNERRNENSIKDINNNALIVISDWFKYFDLKWVF